jgi:hypothetical protein
MLCALSIPDASCCLYTLVQVAAPGKLKIASAGGLQQRSSSATLDDERVDADSHFHPRLCLPRICRLHDQVMFCCVASGMNGDMGK